MLTNTEFTNKVIALARHIYLRHKLTGNIVKLTGIDTTCREFPITAQLTDGETGHFNLRSLEPSTKAEYQQQKATGAITHFIIEQWQAN